PDRIGDDQLAAEAKRPRRVADPHRARAISCERGGGRGRIARTGANLVELAKVFWLRIAAAQYLPRKHVARAAPRARRAILEPRGHEPSTSPTLVYAS